MHSQMKEGRRDAHKQVKSLLAGTDQRETATRLCATFSLRSVSCSCEEEVDLSESDWSFTGCVGVGSWLMRSTWASSV